MLIKDTIAYKIPFKITIFRRMLKSTNRLVTVILVGPQGKITVLRPVLDIFPSYLIDDSEISKASD